MVGSDAAVSDRAAITAALDDYLFSWLDGDPARMAGCLHPQLAKRTQVDPLSGSLELDESPAAAMVASAGRGPRAFGREAEIEIHAVREGIASASVRSEPWLDLAHLARFGDRWRIVNVLYEPRSTATASTADERAIGGVLDAYETAVFADDMDAVLRIHHPALAERRVVDGPDGTPTLEDATLDEVVKAVRQGLEMDRLPRAWEARPLDLGADIVAASVVAGWCDLDLHLARFGRRWLIVNGSYRVLEPPS
jgi:hypothetical protein